MSDIELYNLGEMLIKEDKITIKSTDQLLEEYNLFKEGSYSYQSTSFNICP